MSRGPLLSLHSNLPHDDTSSSEDEEDRLRREEEHEEEEQERVLSRMYGEANEGRGAVVTARELQQQQKQRKEQQQQQQQQRKRSHQQTDAEIIDALNNSKSTNSTSAKNETTADELLLTKTKRVKRAILDESKLTGSNGLIRVRRDFTRIQYKPPKKLRSVYNNKSKTIKSSKAEQQQQQQQRRALKQKQFELDIKASATYISKLMKAYHTFAIDLSPNMHPIDTFHKIESLGSKKKVRDYLHTMREEICKDHLKSVYGDERAEKLVNELENGLKALKDQQDMNMDGDEGKNNGDGHYHNDSGVGGSISSNLRATRNVGVLVEHNNEHESGEEGGEEEEEKEDGEKDKEDRDSDQNEVDEKQSNNDNDNHNNNNNIEDEEDDDDDEIEATFDDVVDTQDNIVKKVEGKENHQQINVGGEDGNANLHNEEETLNDKKISDNYKVSSSREDYNSMMSNDSNKEPLDSEEINHFSDKDLPEENSSEPDVMKDKSFHAEHEADALLDIDEKSNIEDDSTALLETQPEQEKSMIVELTAPTQETQDMDNQEELIVDSSQFPAMTQNTLSQFDDTNIDEFGLDASQTLQNAKEGKEKDDIDKPQTVIATMDDIDETQTVVPTMTPSDSNSQEY